MRMNKFDLISEIIAILTLLVATIFVILRWKDMPDQIPSHYNFAGEPDAYGGKGAIIFTMVMGWVLILTFTILGKLPQLWNTGVERTPANEVVINRIIRDMMSVMQVSMAAMFSYMMVVPVLEVNMGKWFMPLFLGVIFVTLIVTVVRLIRNR